MVNRQRLEEVNTAPPQVDARLDRVEEILESEEEEDSSEEGGASSSEEGGASSSEEMEVGHSRSQTEVGHRLRGRSDTQNLVSMNHSCTFSHQGYGNRLEELGHRAADERRDCPDPNQVIDIWGYCR